MCDTRRKKDTYILSSDRHAIHEQALADLQQGSNLRDTEINQSSKWDRIQEHTWVEEDKAVRADEVDTASSSLATEKKHELLAVRVIELVDKLLPLVNRHGAVQAEVAISNSAASQQAYIVMQGARPMTHFLQRSSFSNKSNV